MGTQARGISHLGIGVRDLDRSIAFYQDALGCTLVDRHSYEVPPDPARAGVDGGAPGELWRREVAVLRVGDRPSDAVLVMSTWQGPGDPVPARLDDLGTNHWAMWVEGIDAAVERLEAAGAEICVPLRTQSGRNWGLPAEASVRTCIVRDPDGTMIQLDELADGAA